MDFSNTSIVDLAAILAEHLKSHGIEVVLVGGLAVEIYTANLYLTKDIDMVNVNYQKPSRLYDVMAELGFYRRGRIYIHDTTDISVEFPTGPLAVAGHRITRTTIANTPKGAIPILYVEDVVKDRIAAYIHWRDKQSLIQAVSILLQHNLLLNEFKFFCLEEGDLSHYEILDELYQSTKTTNIKTMSQLESALTQILISRL
jgi:hypothetical protein